jgi:hypothetical protein
LFFDGTGNNRLNTQERLKNSAIFKDYGEDDNSYANDESNVSRLQAHVKEGSSGYDHHICLYVEGIGTRDLDSASVLACVDHNRSGVESASESYAGDLLSFQIDQPATYGLGLFRVAEDRRLIAVHERVRLALESAHLQGVLYQDTGTYDGRAIASR